MRKSRSQKQWNAADDNEAPVRVASPVDLEALQRGQTFRFSRITRDESMQCIGRGRSWEEYGEIAVRRVWAGTHNSPCDL
jgi:hypothetical protein